MEEHAHDHSHEHGHDHPGHEHEGDEEIDVSGWVAGNEKANCPACGAPGALTLGGGIFCPTCREVTTNAGYTPPDAGPEPSGD